jgi:hypothetical protein
VAMARRQLGTSGGSGVKLSPNRREQRRCSAVLALKAAAVLGSPRGRKYVSITCKAVELITAWRGGKLRTARRKGG